LFDLDINLHTAEVVNYKVDDTLSWLAVTALIPEVCFLSVIQQNKW